MPIYIHVGTLGQPMSLIPLEEGSTVRDALEAAGIALQEGWTVSRNGSYVGLDETLEDGDRVAVMPVPKGG